MFIKTPYALYAFLKKYPFKKGESYATNLEQLSKFLKIQVNTSQQVNNSKILGGIKAITKDSYLINITTNNTTETQKRFTWAHEIAHYLLHKGAIGDGIEEDHLLRSKELNGLMESEANALALEILMPWDKLSNAIDKFFKDGDINFNELAKKFNVHPSDMILRLLGRYPNEKSNHEAVNIERLKISVCGDITII